MNCSYSDLNEKDGTEAMGLEAIVGGEPRGIPWKQGGLSGAIACDQTQPGS